MLVARCDACNRPLWFFRGFIYWSRGGSPDLVCGPCMTKRMASSAAPVRGLRRLSTPTAAKLKALIWWLTSGLWRSF
jgi:hypothetical protein